MTMNTIYLAGGCFWGLQKFFDQFEGVIRTEVGYANGPDRAPSYQEVCADSGHAETVLVEYDEAKMPLKRFIYLSSLSIFGPIREGQPYTEILDTDEPQPNTAYGRSKLLAEKFLEENGKQMAFPYVILRPTGVYGPREKDYFMMAKSIRGHVDFAVGFK